MSKLSQLIAFVMTAVVVQACMVIAGPPPAPKPCPKVKPDDIECNTSQDSMCAGMGVDECRADRWVYEKKSQPLTTKVSLDDVFTWTDTDANNKVICYKYNKCNKNMANQNCVVTTTSAEQTISPMKQEDC